MLKVYGIKNCDTMKKTFKLLDSLKLDYEFFDYKKEAPSATLIKDWKKQLGELPHNPRGRIFKQIKDDFEAASANDKVKLLVENTSAIKRPIVTKNNKIISFGLEEEKLKKLK